MKKIILNRLVMRPLPLNLLYRSNWIRAECLLALRSFRLNSTHNQVVGIFGVHIAGLRWENKVVVDIHKASDPFQKVGRGCASHNQPSIMSRLLLLPAAI
jgi:hypothetical protein